ncbi:hypothetical protein QYF36_024646 [Acer negundo]|nr:hypothetical protein QYF36_024646 [Acer negundo]
MCPFLKNLKVSDDLSFIDFMSTCKVQLQNEEMELLSIIIWQANGNELDSVGGTAMMVPTWRLALASFFMVNTDAATNVNYGKVVVNLINAKSAPYSEIGLILSDIFFLLENSPNFFVGFTLRKGNMVTYNLAKLGLCIVDDYFWLKECLSSVASIVAGYCPSQL